MAKFSNSRDNVHVDSIGRQAAWQKYTFAYCFRPIYIVSRVFGLMPFSITFQLNGNVREPNVSKFDILWFAIWLCHNLLGIFVTFRMANVDPSNPQEFSLISVLGDSGILLLTLIVTSIAMGLNLRNRHKLVDIIKRISNLDKEASHWHGKKS